MMHCGLKNVDDKMTISVKAKAFPDGVKEAFDILESKLPTLKGRKFFGSLKKDAGDEEYRACVEIADEHDIKIPELVLYTIPGGKYATHRVPDWESRVSEIGLLFAEMEKLFKLDFTRPLLEFYKSRKELILMLPIK